LRRGVGRRSEAVAVEMTTRHAFAHPLRLGSIRARKIRRRLEGTGPFDPDRLRPPADATSLRVDIAQSGGG
jgi:hypothetical protein